jgi:hypothetical protein
LVAGSAAAISRCGRVNITQIATDAIGNALGGAFVDSLQPATQGAGPYSAADYRNGMDMDSDNYRPQFAGNYRNGMDMDSDSYNPASAANYRNGMDVDSDNYNPASDPNYRNGMDMDSDNYRGGRRTVSSSGDSLLRDLSRAGFTTEADRRAAYGQLIRTGQLRAEDFNANGIPILENGRELYLDTNDFTAGDRRLAGRLIANESGIRAVNAELKVAAEARAATSNYGNEGRNYPAEVAFGGRSRITDPRAYETDRQAYGRLAAMSDEPSGTYTSEQWKAAAAEYRTREGTGFMRDSVYNGLYMKGAQLEFAAGNPSASAIDQSFSLLNDMGHSAQAGATLGAAAGRGIGNMMGAMGKAQNVVTPQIGSAVQTTSTVDESWKLKIDGTAQATGNDAAHQIRTYREAIALAKNPDVVSVHLDHGYNRALDLDPKTISPNRRPDVTAIYSDGRVARVEVQSATDNLAILRSRNAALDAQIRAQGYTPLPPRVVVPTRSPIP